MYSPYDQFTLAWFFNGKNKNHMPDNPEKKGRDGKRVSQQSHEQAYQKRKQNKNGMKGNGNKTMNVRDNKKTAG